MHLGFLIIGLLATKTVTSYATTTKVKKSDNTTSFLVVAPRTIRPHLPYVISVQILKKFPSDLVVRAEIRNNEHRAVEVEIARNITIGETRLMKIENFAPAKPGNAYRLHIRGEGSEGKSYFEDEKQITFQKKSVSIFVQTDKAIYKPGATVRYRAIVTNPDLTPYKKAVSVRIEDPNHNLLSQALDKKLSKGVFSGDLELSKDCLLGSWKILVETKNGDVYEKVFEVKKYVLPKFDVKVKAPNYMTYSDDLSVFISAKYTFGGGVSGRVKVNITGVYAGNTHYSYGSFDSERTVPLSNAGEAVVVFSNKELKQYEVFAEEAVDSLDISVDATVSEALTNIERKESAVAKMYRDDLLLSCDNTEDFKPGVKHRLIWSVKRTDGSPIIEAAPLHLKATVIYYPEMNEEVKIIELDKNAIGILDIHPSENCSHIYVEGRYDRRGKNDFGSTAMKKTYSMNAKKTIINNFISVSADKEGSVQSGEKLSFTIQTTEPVSSISYHVLARGLIVISGRKQVSNETTKVEFQTTPQMYPKSVLVVSATQSHNRDFIADSITFKVENPFRNNVSISLNRTVAEPGEKIEFRVKSDPNSLVGLLAVDQSVLLLAKDSDITEETVKNDVTQYDADKEFYDYYTKDTALPVFGKAGLVILTDGLFGVKKRPEQDEMLGYAVASEALPMSAMARLSLAPEAVGGGVVSRTAHAPAVRKNFAETWIWREDVSSNKTGEVVFSDAIPDTITSWIASAFAINDESGLGIAPSPFKITTFRPFFVRLTLPYAVKLGEKFALQVLIFNYMNNDQKVTVTLKHNDSFGFRFIRKDEVSKKEEGKKTLPKGYNIRQILVPSGGVPKAVYFPVETTQVGSIKLSVVATSSVAGDSVDQILEVQPEGYRTNRNVPVLIDFRDGNKFLSKKIEQQFPTDIVKGSKFARFTLIGDLMGLTIANIDSLVRMPVGCGEQNMVNFVPNVVLMKYLKATKRDHGPIAEKILKYMKVGYQRELNYKRRDGSFSSFGNSDPKGSTWLTAFVVRSFKQAQPFIFVDDKVLANAIEFLKGKQKPAGSFAEDGKIYDKNILGSPDNEDIALTAYVLIAFLENGMENEKGVSFLEDNLNNIDEEDSYTLAVVSYALQLARSVEKDRALRMLELRKMIESDGSVHWSTPKKSYNLENDEDDFDLEKPADIEATAYALLVYIKSGKIDEGAPIARWLNSKRNEFGGFTSTQDTAIALQALGSYAEKVHSSDVDVSVHLENGEENKFDFEVKEENAAVLQILDLPNPEAPVAISAKGNGTVFAQVQYSYYKVSEKKNKRFSCTKKVREHRNGKRIQLDLCCENMQKSEPSNMVVAEVRSLTGFQFDEGTLSGLTKDNSGVRRAELEDSNTKINLYYDPLDARRSCASLYSDEVYKVSDRKPAQILFYDYYDPKQQVKLSYSLKRSQSLQDICTECWPTEPTQ